MRRKRLTECRAQIPVISSPMSVTMAKTGMMILGSASMISQGSYFRPILSPYQMMMHVSTADVNPIHRLRLMKGLRMNDHLAPTSFME